MVDNTPIKYVLDNSSANLGGSCSPLHLQSTILGLAMDISATRMPQSNLCIESCSRSAGLNDAVSTTTVDFLPTKTKSVTPLKGVHWHTYFGQRNKLERLLLQIGPSRERSTTLTSISFSLSSCSLMQWYKRLIHTASSHPTPICWLLANVYFPHSSTSSPLTTRDNSGSSLRCSDSSVLSTKKKVLNRYLGCLYDQVHNYLYG